MMVTKANGGHRRCGFSHHKRNYFITQVGVIIAEEEREAVGSVLF
jgi:hypothetical protein